MRKLLFVILGLSLLSPAFAQEDLTYQKPPQAILDLADAPRAPQATIDSKGENIVLRTLNQYKSIAELSEKEMRLAGLRINPVTNISSRQRYNNGISVLKVSTGVERQVAGLPSEVRLSNFGWSKDESKMAFTNTTTTGTELWVLDIQTASAKRLVEGKLNANMGRPYRWVDGEHLLVNMLPKDRKALIDADLAIPTGPTISQNDGKKAQNRTYQDLLKNKTDEFNFKQLAKSTLYKVSITGEQTKWMNTAIYSGVSMSPDGNYVMVTTVEEPFSYLVPYNRFPSKTVVYDKNGAKVKKMLEVPLIEDLPKGFMAARKGMRGLRWRNDKPSTLYWAEVLDGGDPANETEYRDAVYQQAAPFTSEKKHLIDVKGRFAGMDWGNATTAVAYDYWWNTRNTKAYLFNPSDDKVAPRMVYDRNYQDRYNDPGSFVKVENDYGRDVLVMDNNKLFRLGAGHSAEGVYPFVDEYNMAKLEAKRLWQATDTEKLERVRGAIDIKKGIILSSIESPTEYPVMYTRNIFKPKEAPKQLYDFKNPFESIKDIHKEVVTYKRDDGLELSATLYLPVGYDKAKKEKMPMVMWAYPREFKDKSSAGQKSADPREFVFPWYGSPIFWVTRGYVVLDDASFPIVGEGDEEPNDSFRKQLVANAKAAIDAVDGMGYIDRNRVAVGGHSYGAFMTANLLTHSDLFKAGIARSGAYNRTLTPFGFQSEERNYWEAPEVYYEMSPFSHADKMKHALLMIHGADDNNSGTYPMQTERYFNALKGLGATARMVMLPKESHGYAAKESVLHVLWEQDQWLEKYVKNAPMK